MKVAFWAAAMLVAYSYFGYPLILWLWCCIRPRPTKRAQIVPTVSIIMAVRNEASTLQAKLRNLAMLDYPKEKLEIVVVSDGSTDETVPILRAHASEALKLIANNVARGKAAALNDAFRKAQGELVVFTDARQKLAPDALRRLVASFADPTVGCVSGELMFTDESGAVGAGLGLYWALEKKIRRMEAVVSSTIGATGAFYAVRRNLIRELPAGTLLDDVFMPCQVIRQGYRVLFEPDAIAWDRVATDAAVEFRRKVRTLTGNYQLIRILPWLLVPGYPVWFQFVSHKLTRLAVPFALAVCLIASATAPGALYREALFAQLAAYAFATVALLLPRLGPLSRFGSVARTFLLLNVAAAVAFFNFLRHKEEVWTR